MLDDDPISQSWHDDGALFPWFRIRGTGEVVAHAASCLPLLQAWSNGSQLQLPTHTLQKILQAGLTPPFETRMSGPDGHYLLHVRPGQTTGEYDVFVQDVSPQMEHIRALQDSLAAAQADGRSQSEWIANLSHELRTPLQAIMGYSEMLIATADDRRVIEVLRMLQKIHGAGNTLLDLINSVLDAAKLQAGKTEIHARDVELQRVVRDAVDLVLPQAERRGNTILVDMPSTTHLLHTDGAKLRQCLVNFLSNAVKFTDHGAITVTAVPQGADVLFSVRDTGIGMTADQVQRVFEAYQQADASISGRFGGTGLGLSITREFCHMLGGEIRVSSSPGQGSEFQMRIPCQIPTRAMPQTTQTAAQTTPVAQQSVPQADPTTSAQPWSMPTTSTSQ